ncbi:PLP-dependent aminotransferase family protein [Cereibacter sphaeroides]|uniref:aminotransferase-like domain-containing protein n=1 Tax=Cereibacter sphaeroides TaxID=1063 RepID=UPI0002A342CB|nr:Aspartate aminotransferase [Rhodobacter sp. AKP1]
MKLRIEIDRTRSIGLSDQIAAQISRMIFEGRIAPGLKLPSCRLMARSVGVSLNTVIAAYQTLQDEQLIVARPRSGFFVRSGLGVHPDRTAQFPAPDQKPARIVQKLNLARRAYGIDTIFRPQNWFAQPYPFVCNQISEHDFPVAAWRKCAQLAMNRKDLKIWSSDGHYADSPDLIRQVNQRILPSRGIAADPASTLITLGSQNGLYLTGFLFGGRDRVAAMEDPGYPDARRILTAHFGSVRFQPVDAEGLVVDDRLRGVDLVFVTPNRQFPTTVTMSPARRRALLEAAEEHDFYIVEDDYECDVDYRQIPPLSLRAQDDRGRVIYLGSLSKGLSPGLRLGYLNAAPDFVAAARDSRGMILRHPPFLLQQTAAAFVDLGYYDRLLRRLKRDHEQRWRIANAALADSLRGLDVISEFGGTNFLLTDPQCHLQADALARAALARGIVIEAVAPCYSCRAQGAHSFRIGVSSIGQDRIRPGLALLSDLVADLRPTGIHSAPPSGAGPSATPAQAPGRKKQCPILKAGLVPDSTDTAAR